MTATIEKNELVIRLTIDGSAPFSKSGKTRVIATTRGFANAGVTVNSKPVSVSINAVIPA